MSRRFTTSHELGREFPEQVREARLLGWEVRDRRGRLEAVHQAEQIMVHAEPKRRPEGRVMAMDQLMTLVRVRTPRAYRDTSNA